MNLSVPENVIFLQGILFVFLEPNCLSFSSVVSQVPFVYPLVPLSFRLTARINNNNDENEIVTEKLQHVM